MRILFLDAYFEPEQIAFTHLENDLIEGLVDAGHEIEIVCPTPTRGISPEAAKEYKNKKQETLFDGRVHVTRFLAPKEGKSPVARAVRYFWCNFRTYSIGKRVKNIDIVFSNSTPPTQGWIAGKVARKQNVPFIYSLQDIFPDSLITTGLARKESLIWKVGRKLEDETYKQCTQIIVPSEAMKENLCQKGVVEQKIDLISNWIDIDQIFLISREDNSLFDEFEISRDKFIVLYAGNFGAAQGAEILFDVAEQLKSNENIQFVIFGGGAGYKAAEERAKSLKNVFIHSLLPQNRVSEVYNMGDVALITCKKGVGNSGMPSKTWSIMACNTPIIASFDQESELANILNKSKTGKTIEAENTNELMKAIIEEYNNPTSCETNGREFVKEYASKEKCVGKYLDIFEFLSVDKE